MSQFKHKKRFGQHFLNNESIAKAIVNHFLEKNSSKDILEIGPGEGVLTKYLAGQEELNLHISEIDTGLIEFIQQEFGVDDKRFIKGDFVQMDLQHYMKDQFSIVGNFPYNISTQIIFKVLEYKEQVPFVVGMFQKEVADRIVAKHGSKTYGITSVLTQAYFDAHHLFNVEPEEFTPPPKVRSSVIELVRKETFPENLDQKLFFRVVKAGFNQRRKTLRNALKPLVLQPELIDPVVLSKRAEQLSVEEWIQLTRKINLQL